MNKQKAILYFLLLSMATLSLKNTSADDGTRQKVIKLLTSAGLSEELNAGVKISADKTGIVCIVDEGNFFMQYIVVEPGVSAGADPVMDPNLNIPSSASNVVIVTHGWMDKGVNDWPADIAREIRKRVDPNEWICAFFDWQGGAAVVNPVDAVKYARTVAGPRLAKAVLNLGIKFEHIHLIAHSAGCWAIDAAAAKIADETQANIHLTFLDAYVPPFWKKSHLGKIESKNTIWAEHYYTKDITFDCTQNNLSEAHNVDISQLDPIITEHEFPYRWYLASIAGKYRSSDAEADEKVFTEYKGLHYGFARSVEAGRESWQKSLTLKKGETAVKLEKPKKNKLFDLEFFKKSKGKKNE